MCGCSGQVGNCNCNDCSLITVPSIVGPQGLPGPAGPQGVNGDDGFHVLDIQTFLNVGIPSLPSYLTFGTPTYQVNVSNHLNSARDKIKIKGLFIVESSSPPYNYIFGIAINNIPFASPTQTPLFQLGNGVLPILSLPVERFYFEVELSRSNINVYSVNGFMFHGNVTVSPGLNVSQNISNTKIIRNISFTSPHLSSNFYIYFYTTNDAKFETTLEYISIEHKNGI